MSQNDHTNQTVSQDFHEQVSFSNAACFKKRAFLLTILVNVSWHQLSFTGCFSEL